MSRIFAAAIVALALLAPAALAAPEALAVTPATIHEAAARGNLESVQTLLEQKPSLLNARDKAGATPLHFAVAAGHGELVEFLVARKADVNARKHDGVTPLHVAASLGHQAIAESLIAHKADVNAVDRKGRTPLSLAQAKGHATIAAQLQTAGAKVAPKPATLKPVKPKSATPKPATPKPTAPKPVAPKPVKPKLTATKPAKPAVKRSAPAKTDLKAVSLDLTRRMDRGDFATIVKRFDGTMAASLPEAPLRQMWTQLTTQYGRFQMTGAARQQKVVEGGKPLDVVTVPARFGQTPLNVQFAYSPEGRISGFFILDPSQAP